MAHGFPFSEKSLTAGLRRHLREDYTNPERLGCPDGALLSKVFERHEPDKVAVLQHLRACSDCFRDYINLSRGQRQKLRRRRTD